MLLQNATLILNLKQLSDNSDISKSNHSNNEILNLFLFFNQFFTPLFASLTVVSCGRARLWWSKPLLGPSVWVEPVVSASLSYS